LWPCLVTLGISPPRPDQHWDPPSLLSNGCRSPFPGDKVAGAWSDHSPPSSAEVKNAWSYTSNPQYVFNAWCLVKHRDNFTFTFNIFGNVSSRSVLRSYCDELRLRKAISLFGTIKWTSLMKWGGGGVRVMWSWKLCTVGRNSRRNRIIK
jgi:hypothetical protein